MVRDVSWKFEKKLTIPAVCLIVSWFVGGIVLAVQQAQANIYQDIRLSRLEINVAQLAAISERVARLEENQKIQIDLQKQQNQSINQMNQTLLAIQRD